MKYIKYKTKINYNILLNVLLVCEYAMHDKENNN